MKNAMHSLAPRQKADLDACRSVIALEEEILAEKTTTPKAATKYATQIMGCFRARDFQDPDTFAVALVAHLCRYPEPIVKMIACPLNGVARTHQFCPSISEIADALEQLSNRIRVVAAPARRALQAV